MIRRVKVFIFFLLIFGLGLKLNAKETKAPEYLKYVKEIITDFANDMEKEYKIHCCGSGGSMPHDVEKIEVMFSSFRKSTVEDARKMEVNGIKKLLHYINAHEKIRPYLREYPFNPNRVGVSIAFQMKTGGRPLDGSVALVFLARSRIFYNAAEIRMEEPTPLIYMNEKKEVVKEMIGGGPSEELISIMDESYEEALKILANDSFEKKN